MCTVTLGTVKREPPVPTKMTDFGKKQRHGLVQICFKLGFPLRCENDRKLHAVVLEWCTIAGFLLKILIIMYANFT